MLSRVDASALCRLPRVSLQYVKHAYPWARQTFQLSQLRCGDIRHYSEKDALSVVPKPNSKASQLEITTARVGHNGRRSSWPEDEVKALQHAFEQGLTDKEIAAQALPGRTAGAIALKRLQLRLTKTKGWSKSKKPHQLITDLHERGLTVTQMMHHLKIHDIGVKGISVRGILKSLGLSPNRPGTSGTDRNTPRSNYTVEEKQIVREGIERGWTLDEFARDLPGRDAESIRGARWRLQLSLAEPANARRLWTSQEERIVLEARAANAPIAELAVQLGRTPKAIVMKLMKLNKRLGEGG